MDNKTTYTEPVLEIVVFEENDIVTVSPPAQLDDIDD